MESLFLQQVVNGLIVGSVYSLIAVGLTMIFGVMRISNFAHGDFSMVGAYIAVFILAWVPGWFGWVGSLVAALAGVGILGLVVERGLFRPLITRWTDLDQIMASVGLFFVMENLAQLFFGATPRMLPDPFQGATVDFGLFSTSMMRVLCISMAVGIIILLQIYLNRARMGVAIQATAQNRNAAQLMGININLIYGLTFALGSALAGLGGVLYGTIFAIYPTMGAIPTLKAFVVTILGGMGNIRGAIFSGFILGVAESLGGAYVSMEYKNAIGFVILILVLLIIPHGLFGRSEE
ncbi:MAG: branched-chain amino acid ABC transporter permease [Desulfarculaceae bacterium]|nr:branched-chain amino acid ABC transporter permease [Desulfarculaceae bacterium]MCF8074286.1 branched-chain amino acid ABC transporter permease [Desulfarculaceae bacterium]MCF8103354.1 branched-chain amino acid ABC transporter permease [Desulfarculaceae bacterium]MCF8117856.1 branched-chain amino acid ABC transporter permease [Desulfarculaceae bacterium]